MECVGFVTSNWGMQPDAGTSRTTMRQLASRLGLSTMTVSRALRNAVGVSADTRRRVHAAAELQGYVPDPLLGVLNAYRHGRRQVAAREKIAFVTNFSTPDGWRRVLTFARYFDGAQRRARQLGYDLEPFWLGDPSLTERRASQILRGRGIRGVVVGPLADGRSELRLDWSHFSAVAVGRSLTAPQLTTVSINHTQAFELAWNEAWKRGYRRIGLVLTEGEDQRTTGSLRASCVLQQLRVRTGLVPILFTPGFSGSAMLTWQHECAPDVILSSEQSHYDALRAARPRALLPPFVHLNVDPAAPDAGVDQGHDLVGEQAAALLHLKLIQQQTGVPHPRELLLIDGRWYEGRGRGRLPDCHARGRLRSPAG